MTMVTEYDWESDTWTHHTADNAARAACREAVAEIADKAKATLPDCTGRVDRAVAIVLNHDVELLEDGKARVCSQSNGQVVYHVVNGECSCKDYAKAPSNWCKHRIAAGLYKRATALVQRKLAQHANGASNGQVATAPDPVPVQAETSAVPLAQGPSPAHAEAPGLPESLKPYVVHLHGKPFIRYVGLLALAHERGLVQLTARIEFHSDALVLASATATFQDGRVFTEWADAMPGNVSAQVRPHWVRMALTRAKSRCLRDALKTASPHSKNWQTSSGHWAGHTLCPSRARGAHAMRIERYGKTQYWAVYDGATLVCVCLYKKGAQEVVRRLANR